MTALDLAKEWLRYAKSDLNTARHMFDGAHTNELAIDDGITKQAIDNVEKLHVFCEKMINNIIEKTEQTN